MGLLTLQKITKIYVHNVNNYCCSHFSHNYINHDKIIMQLSSLQGSSLYNRILDKVSWKIKMQWWTKREAHHALPGCCTRNCCHKLRTFRFFASQSTCSPDNKRTAVCYFLQACKPNILSWLCFSEMKPEAESSHLTLDLSPSRV